MSKSTKKTAPQAEQATENNENVCTTAEESNDTQQSVGELLARIAELEGALAERDDKYLRMAAEYENFRRRSREEREGIYDSALSDAVGALLPIIDNLERAEGFSDPAGVLEGLKMISNSAHAALAALGVESYGAVGDEFDPNVHNAVMHVDDDALGEGVIAEVFQKGYRHAKRIIRFAMVKSAN